MAIDIPSKLVLGIRARDNCCFISWQETPTTVNSERKFEQWSESRIEVDNNFRTGFKISIEKRSGMSADFAKIVFPEGYVFELNMSNLLDIISKTTIVNGEIQEKCAVSKNRTLVTEKEVENSNVEFVADKDLVKGCSYAKICHKTGKELYRFIYLDKIASVDNKDYQLSTSFEKKSIVIVKQKESVSSKQESYKSVYISSYKKTKDFNKLIDDIDYNEYKDLFYKKEFPKWNFSIPILDINGRFCDKKIQLDQVVLKLKTKEEKNNSNTISYLVINGKLSTGYVRSFQTIHLKEDRIISIEKQSGFLEDGRELMFLLEPNKPISKLEQETKSKFFTFRNNEAEVKDGINIEFLDYFYFLSLVAPGE